MAKFTKKFLTMLENEAINLLKKEIKKKTKPKAEARFKDDEVF